MSKTKIDYKKLKDLVNKVKNWADERNLISKENIVSQYNYIHLELTELYEAVKLKEKINTITPETPEFTFRIGNVIGYYDLTMPPDLRFLILYFDDSDFGDENKYLTKDALLSLIENEIIDGYGDTMVTLINMSYCDSLIAQQHFNMIFNEDFIKAYCIEKAYYSTLEDLQNFRYYTLKRDSWFPECFAKFAALTSRQGHDPIKCLEHAYNEIKDRKGKIIDGDFVKE